jgi:hypothetical protein
VEVALQSDLLRQPNFNTLNWAGRRISLSLEKIVVHASRAARRGRWWHGLCIAKIRTEGEMFIWFFSNLSLLGQNRMNNLMKAQS